MNGIDEKVLFSRYCFEYDCEKMSTFNYEGQKKGLYCSKHKKDGMIDNIYSIYNKMDLTKKELKMLWGMHKKLKNLPKI